MLFSNIALHELTQRRSSLAVSEESHGSVILQDSRDARNDGASFLETNNSAKPIDQQPLFSKATADFTTRSSTSSIVTWWLPELAASVLSLALFASIVGLLRTYDGRLAADLQLTSSLTLNGLLALIATINRACLTAPVASAIMREMRLYIAQEGESEACKSRLNDLELFAHASNGVAGSILFMLHARRTRSARAVVRWSSSGS